MREWTISALSARLRAGELTSEALVAECIRRAEQTSGQRYIFLDAEQALTLARASDERRKNGDTRGILDGIPYVVEDRFCTKGMLTENGCRILKGYRPPYDAEIVSRMRAEGAILLGKLATDGFLAGSVSSANSAEITRAVAEGEIPFAICADTGGSAFCEHLGSAVLFRYADAELSRGGLIPVAPSFDGIVTVTQTIEDARLLFEAFSNTRNTNKTPRVTEMDLSGLSLEKIKKSYRILSAVETASEMALYDGIRFGASVADLESVEGRMSKTRGAFFSYDEKKILLLGTAWLMDEHRTSCYLSARAYREEVRGVFDRMLRSFDVIRLPLTAQTSVLPSYLGCSVLARDGVLLMSDGKSGGLLFDSVGSEEGGSNES